MSSESSFVCLSTFNIEKTDDISDQWSFGNDDNLLQQEQFSIVNESDYNNMNDNNDKEWSSINDNNFDVESIASIASIDTVKANFIFADYTFNKKTNNESKSPSKWLWLNTNRRKRKFKQRRKNGISSILVGIDENGEIEQEEIDRKEEEEKEKENKTVIDIKDLNDFINKTIKVNRNITDIMNLCNKICNDGILNVDNMEIELHEMPLIGLKLRDIFFRKLILINNDNDKQYENIHILRREYWLKLSMESRVYLLPFGSFDDFINLYDVHCSVKWNEFLAVIDLESFEILRKPEWCRSVLFKDYITKIKNLKRCSVINNNIKIKEFDEMQSLLGIGNFNNMKQLYQKKQLSMIMSDTYSDTFEDFDALETEIMNSLRIQSET